MDVPLTKSLNTDVTSTFIISERASVQTSGNGVNVDLSHVRFTTSRDTVDIRHISNDICDIAGMTESVPDCNAGSTFGSRMSEDAG